MRVVEGFPQSGGSPQQEASGWRAILHRWPGALGVLAAAAFIAVGPDTQNVTTAICVAALSYLAAAAFNRRWVAWAGCLAFSLIVGESHAIGAAWWVVPVLSALVLVAVGLLLRVPRQLLGAQTAAVIGYGGIAVVALLLEPRVGLVLAGVGLIGHGVWDVIHYRRNQVVTRSLAEFCVVLDVPLGLGAILFAMMGSPS